VRRTPTLARLAGRLLLAGLAAWAAYDRFLAPGDRIVVSGALRDGLRADHHRRTGRPPSPAEESALVDAWIEDELLYREALALGLDRRDVVVRRRLVQSMGFLLEEEAAGTPDDAALRAYLTAHAERFATAPSVTFEHVFVRAGADADADAGRERARSLRAQLDAGADSSRLGDPFPHGWRIAGRTPAEIDGTFGAGFAARIATLPLGAWSEPVASSYGLHLVRVVVREAGGVPELATIRAAVAADWRHAQREAARRRGFARLRRRYDVVREDGAGTARASELP
jgi:hypothetical protein